jgi:hypothetical protein
VVRLLDSQRAVFSGALLVGNPLTDLASGAFGGIVDSIGNVIGKFVTDPNAKLAAQLEVSKIANDYQVQLLQADKEFAVQQASVVIAEAKSESWISRNWRPIFSLTLTSIVAFNFVLAPIINMFASTCVPNAAGVVTCVGRLKALDIPPNMWGLLTLCLSGYIVGRSVEKITDTKATRDITVANVTANAAQ